MGNLSISVAFLLPPFTDTPIWLVTFIGKVVGAIDKLHLRSAPSQTNSDNLQWFYVQVTI